MPIGVSGYNELIESFAASIGLDGVETEGGAAAFEIDGMKVDIFHDDSADTVMIYGEIGQPPSEDDRSFGPAMLKANHLFGGTGGATLCQDPETGEYAIFQAEHWRNILNAFQTAEREKGAAAAEEVLLDAIHGGAGGFIQV